MFGKKKVSENGFGASTTGEEVTKGMDISKKNIIITGANTGIGKETARVLALRGANVFIGCRSQEKMDQAIKDIKETNKDAKITGIPLDLGDVSTIDSFVETFEKLNIPLHILINNAGVMAPKDRRTTKDGFEYQFGINHLGHFRLTLKLLTIMAKTSKDENCECRIVNLSSSAHTMGTKKINFDDIHHEKKGAYKPWPVYGQSKLSNIMFSNELTKRLSSDKVNIIVNSLHPGVIATELSRDLDTTSSLMWTLGKGFMKSIPQGAATTIYCAVSPEINGKSGLYFSDCNVASPIPYVNNEEALKKLFEVSIKETGIEYPNLTN
eukprot:gene5055-8650_t